MLAKRRMALSTINWQHLGSAAINAFILGHLNVNPRGEATWNPDGDAGTFSEDPAEAVRQVRAAVKGREPTPRKVREWWDVRDLAEHIEERTGKRIGLQMFRMYLRQEWMHIKDHERARYKFRPDTREGRKVIDQIVSDVAGGVLDRMRAERFALFGKDDPLKGKT